MDPQPSTFSWKLIAIIIAIVLLILGFIYYKWFRNDNNIDIQQIEKMKHAEELKRENDKLASDKKELADKLKKTKDKLHKERDTYAKRLDSIEAKLKSSE